MSSPLMQSSRTTRTRTWSSLQASAQTALWCAYTHSSGEDETAAYVQIQRLDRAVAAGGRGLHGQTANGNTGPDGLFSQGSVQVSAKNRLLATVNVGPLLEQSRSFIENVWHRPVRTRFRCSISTLASPLASPRLATQSRPKASSLSP